jgi:hypothetical protein
MGGARNTYRKRRSVYRVVVGESEGKRPVERHKRTWEDNIKKDLQETRWRSFPAWIWLRIRTGGGYL